MKALSAASPTASRVVSSIASVRSIAWPASTTSASLPPPRAMKMSGASPELRAVWSLPSMSSFWMAWISIVTPGFASSNAATVSSQ
ncbi:Uncharacterised protein [Mycobacteroides abscessus]|nr:Uncharacterised protein [Mycobacteroides abscessus]